MRAPFNKKTYIDSMKNIVLIISAVCIGFVSWSNADAQHSAKEQVQQKTEKSLKRVIDKSPAITGLVAVDLTTNDMVFSHNKEVAFPQASAIKIPILMEVYKQAHEGLISLSERRAIDSDALVGGTGILKNLEGDLSMSIKNLSVLMIALSDNSATNMLIDLVGMGSINKGLQDVGADQTKLQRKMMAIEASAKNRENISTPADAAHILQLLYNGAFINKEISSKIVSTLKKTPRNESRLSAGIPGSVPIAFKPGGLQGVSTEWAIILLKERPYAVAVMENHKVKGQGEQTVEKLSKILYQYFWRMGNATRYGVYRDPALMNK